MDFLTIWGVTQAVGFAFGAVMGDLAKGALEDYVKDFFKERLQGLVDRFGPDPLKVATGKAVKGFLELVQRELEDCFDDDLERVQAYTESLQQFIVDTEVAGALGSVFADAGQVDLVILAKRWLALNLKPLPEEFNWQKIGKRYQKYTRDLIGADKQLRAIAQFEMVAETRDLVRDLAGPAVDFDLSAYAQSLQINYGKLPLDQLTNDGGVYSAKLWQVFLPQQARECGDYLPQLDKLPKELLRQYGLIGERDDEVQKERLRNIYHNQVSRSVTEIINDSTINSLIILGDPGSGKSTLLKYLALDWATYENELIKVNEIRPVDQLLSRPLPLLVELRLWARQPSLDLLEYFHAGNVVDRLNKSQLYEQLVAGKALLLFDGLDEVFDPLRREEVVREIGRLSHEYPSVKIIVTSRIYGYQRHAKSLINHGFRHWLLEEFTDNQIEEFCDRWHQETFDTKERANRDRCRERLRDAIIRSRTIRELAGNPLMLTMMCILNRKSRLPDERLEFYRQATDLLLRDWDVEHKNLPDRCQEILRLTLNQKQKIVRQVAFFLQNIDGGLAGNLICKSDLQAIVANCLRTLSLQNPEGWAEDLINILQERNFTLCSAGTGYYAFVHRTFLEYFCAIEIWERFNQRDSGSNDAISTDHLIHSVFGQHWNDDAWREVLILLASQLPIGFAKQAITLLIQLDHATSEEADFVNLFLAADCLAELPERASIAELDRDLLQRLRSLTAGGALLEHTDQKGFDFKQRIEKVRERVVHYVAQHWQNDPDTLPWLKKCARFNENQNVRKAAIQKLVWGWKEDPDTLSLLRNRACSDEDALLRRFILQILTSYWEEDLDTLLILKNRVLLDESEWVRHAAVQKLALYRKKDPDILPLLKDQVLSNEDDWIVGQAVVQALAQYWKEDPDTLLLLRNLALSAEDDWIRSSAVEELAQGWQEHPDTLSLLKKIAQSDKSWLVRNGAVEDLAQNWQGLPDILLLLKKLARSDGDWPVRQAAIEGLAQGWKENPEVFDFLCEVTTQDPFQRAEYEDALNPRQTALEELLEIAPNSPQVIDLLSDRAANDPDDLLREWATEQLTQLNLDQSKSND